MGRRKLDQPASVGQAMQQLETFVSDIDRNKPNWVMQHKAHNEYTHDMREREVLKDGFAGFYQHSEPVDRVGDTVRKHGEHLEYGKEEMWKPCFRLVKLDPKPGMRRGKRPIKPNNAISADEIPRGRKHVPPPVDQLSDEMELFQTRHKARDSEGNLIALKRGEAHDATKLGRGRVDDIDKRRNGIPQARSGDKLFSSVEYSAEYAASMSPALPRLNYPKITQHVAPVDVWVLKESNRQYSSDVQAVRDLPDFN